MPVQLFAWEAGNVEDLLCVLHDAKDLVARDNDATSARLIGVQVEALPGHIRRIALMKTILADGSPVYDLAIQ
jgi:hypothetical protein